MKDPTFAALNSEQCDELLVAAQHLTDVARKASTLLGKIDDPLQIETTIISMCVAILIAQEGSHGDDSKRKPVGIDGRLLEARILGAGAGIGQIIGQMPVAIMPRLLEATSMGIGQAVTKSVSRR